MAESRDRTPMAGAATNARRLALRALEAWEDTAGSRDQGGRDSGSPFGTNPRHADEILASLTGGRSLDPRDRALFQHLFYGVLRHLRSLDALADRLHRGKRLKPENRRLLRLGLLQLLILDLPPHAAVNETVSLSRHARPLINGILRTADREREGLLAWLADQPPGLRFSHPDFLIERWTDRYGPELTSQLCRWNNTPPPVFLRRNPFVPEAAEALTRDPRLESLSDWPGFYRLESGGIPEDWLKQGFVYAQDPSTSLAVALAQAEAGERVLDACAAPGGKASLLAAAVGDTGSVTACDRVPSRLQQLRENLERLHVPNAEVAAVDWENPETVADAGLDPAGYDLVFLDVPCSNTGVMRRRADLRWRLEPGDFTRQATLQRRILEATLPHLAPGGRLVYSTCSLEPEENRDQINHFLAAHPELRLEEESHSLPWANGADGAYAARLRRR